MRVPGLREKAIATPRILKLEQAGYLLHLPLRWEGLLCGGGLCDEEYGYYAGGRRGRGVAGGRPWYDPRGVADEARHPAGKEPGGKKEEALGAKKEEAEAAAPAKMSMADRIAAMQKGIVMISPISPAL